MYETEPTQGTRIFFAELNAGEGGAAPVYVAADYTEANNGGELANIKSLNDLPGFEYSQYAAGRLHQTDEAGDPDECIRQGKGMYSPGKITGALGNGPATIEQAFELKGLTLRWLIRFPSGSGLVGTGTFSKATPNAGGENNNESSIPFEIFANNGFKPIDLKDAAHTAEDPAAAAGG